MHFLPIFYLKIRVGKFAGHGTYTLSIFFFEIKSIVCINEFLSQSQFPKKTVELQISHNKLFKKKMGTSAGEEVKKGRERGEEIQDSHLHTDLKNYMCLIELFT